MFFCLISLKHSCERGGLLTHWQDRWWVKSKRGTQLFATCWGHFHSVPNWFLQVGLWNLWMWIWRWILNIRCFSQWFKLSLTIVGIIFGTALRFWVFNEWSKHLGIGWRVHDFFFKRCSQAFHIGLRQTASLLFFVNKHDWISTKEPAAVSHSNASEGRFFPQPC